MKQIARLKLLAALFFLTFSFLAAFSAVTPQTAFAAGCQERPATDSQATAQMECVKDYITQCKKDFPGRKAVCENLSAVQINRCTTDKNNHKLKEDCFKKIQAPDTEGSEDCTDCVATDYDENDCTAGTFDQLDGDNCGVLKYILLITNVLSGLAATVIVAMMIVGGIQYSSAGADPSKVQAAKQKIFNALLALALFIFGFALIQWLVPGGLF